MPTMAAMMTAASNTARDAPLAVLAPLKAIEGNGDGGGSDEILDHGAPQ
jgi:hypothetical protein